MLSNEPVYRTISINMIRHKGSDLMLAISDDLPCLMIPVRHTDDLAVKVTMASGEILETQSYRLGEVISVYDDSGLPVEFAPATFSAKAQV